MSLKLILLSNIIETFIVTVAAQINLAPLGDAVQHTTYARYTSANKAVDGPANNRWDDGCFATDTGQKYAWWGLQLSAVAHMTNIVIYYRENSASRMDMFRLYLENGTADQSSDSGLCYTDKGIPGLPSITQNITCNMLAKNMYFLNRRTRANCFVELCYVAIYGCWKGTWGTNCTKSCPANCINQNCYPETGLCVWGCDPHNCLNSKCDMQSSFCTDGCVIGRAGQYCNKHNLAFTGEATQNPPDNNFPARWSIDGNRTSNNCSKTTGLNAYLQVDTQSLSVIHAIYLTFRDADTEPIPSSDYTVYGSNTSNSWSGSDSIELYKGERPTGDILVFAVCRYIIYVPPVVNGMQIVDICEIEIGGCPLGKYGVNCGSSCYCKEPCNLDTGSCTSGCLDGWMGEKCDQACDPGYFGNDCSRKCSENCFNPHCHHDTGECIGGCKKGWVENNCTKECDLGYFGLNCSQSCPGCVSNMCDKFNGSCSNISACEPGYVKGPYCDQECDDWYFGINCASKCNCLKDVCKKSNGECSAKGCEKGWQGFACDKECDNGFYGLNCKEQCATCFNMSCERLEGNCSYDCTDRYEGVKCQHLVNEDLNIRDNNSSASIGGSIGAALVIILVVAILIILYRRRSKPKRKKNLRHQDKISRSDENSYCNHKIALTTEDVYLNVDSVQDSAKAKPSLAGKKEIKTIRIEVIDEYPEEHDEEDEGNVYNNVPSQQTITQHKIPLADLKRVIIEKRKEDDFKNEYEFLPKGLVHAHTEGSKEENKDKNRFLTTWPYDHSRVVLTGDTKHDYINANYIDSYNKEKAYIASQGPKKNTLRDFWQMVWQEKVSKIVMVTKLEEERRKKCEQYWPKTINKATIVDNYRLTMTEEKYHTVYVYRLIIVHNKTNQQERKVHHFHFTEWPDHGVPDGIKLVQFYRKVKNEKYDKIGPMVVHCSAGVGRTGTFIAIDALYEHSRKVGFIDVMEYVQMMRKDRMNMIQTHEQYEIVFEALLELFTVPDTSIQKNDFCGHIQKQDNKTLPKNQTMYSEEFQRLRTLRPLYSADNFTAANYKENKPKNSSTAVLAHDNYRPYLVSYGKTRSDYINAVIIPGYAVDSKMFVTQCPLVETVIDFWTMIYDHSSRIIVLLDPGNEGAPLWLEKKEMLQFDDFRIIKETENTQEELQLTLNHTKNKEQITINVFTANNWTISNSPPSPEYMLDLLQRVQNCWKTQKVPITVVCSDGCSKSGLFVALQSILEKLQIDDEIDIFQVVRELQRRRPEFLVEFDQYEYCYRCVRVLLEGDTSDSLYANI